MFPLYAILDTALALARGYEPVDLARRFFDGGAKLLQLRAKDVPAGQVLDWSLAIAEHAARAGAVFIVNDRADVALMTGADGVHAGQEDLPAAAVRRLAPPPFLIGLSTHTPAQIAAAAREPVDYLAIGPVFGTATKETGYAAVGLDLVGEASRNAAGLPAVAIGGITLENAPSVVAVGASSVAVISDLLAGDPAGRVREYLRALR
ncbi:MAG: thiamine phosphate synthase [Nannocystis sp.]|nr:thiamine phosphate synthase [Nannocystis sp.]MBA3546874.1 thiamine phosphate synthase [Nannocystis sp.]